VLAGTAQINFPSNPSKWEAIAKVASRYLFPLNKGKQTMFTILFILIALLTLGWAIWFVVAFLHYLASGQYELDRRLQQFKR
jgi:nitrogen fixation/metabolism regulation signal transduction histidine kinase